MGATEATLCCGAKLKLEEGTGKPEGLEDRNGTRLVAELGLPGEDKPNVVSARMNFIEQIAGALGHG